MCNAFGLCIGAGVCDWNRIIFGSTVANGLFGELPYLFNFYDCKMKFVV